LRFAQGDFVQALQWYTDCCEASKREYGTHYFTAAAYHKVGATNIKLGQIQEAM
jgi:hypothetical protein